MKQKWSAMLLAVALTLSLLFTGCAPAHRGSQPVVVAPAASVPVAAAPDGADPVDAAEPVADEPDDTEPDAEPAADEPDAAEPVENDVASADVGSEETPYEYHRLTEEERMLANMEMYRDLCAAKATVETSLDACVVDTRTAENPYDVEWNYGAAYDRLVARTDWSELFDADYYMAQFPVLAYQYHYDKDLLLQHFQTVGVHEGRQGSASFNVADYMAKCDDGVKAVYGDVYAAYYFHWANMETDRSMDVSGHGQPKQLAAVLTAMQAKEFEQVNALRENNGLAPYVYDSELAAFAAFRGWVDAAEDWDAHDWLYANETECYKLLEMLGTQTVGENTTKRYSVSYTNWYEGYYHSKDHHDAMVDPDYTHFGCSNTYAGDTTRRPSGNLAVEFDTFAKNPHTALNP